MEKHDPEARNSAPTMKARIAKTLLLTLTIGTSVFVAFAVGETIKDRTYLKQQVIDSDSGVRHVRGTIEKAKPLYLGKSHNNLRLRVSGLNKWVYITRVDDTTAKDFVVGSFIEIDVYRPRPDAVITRRFVRDHVVRALGYSIDGKVLRETEVAKQCLVWGQFANFAMSVFCLFVTCGGAFAIYHFDFDKKSIRKKPLQVEETVPG